MRRLAIALIAAHSLAAGAAESIPVRSLLAEMSDPAAVARFPAPEYQCLPASSYLEQAWKLRDEIKAKIFAPAMKGLQAEQTFPNGEALVIPGKRGMLLVVEDGTEKCRQTARMIILR
jgi:hypothetical protein